MRGSRISSARDVRRVRQPGRLHVHDLSLHRREPQRPRGSGRARVGLRLSTESTRTTRTASSRRTRSHPNLKNTKTDEFMVGIDHQILPELVAGVTYTHRHRSDYINGHLHRRHRGRLRSRSERGAASRPMTSRAISSERPGNYYDFIAPAGFNGGVISTNDPRFHDRLQRRRAAVDEAALQPLDGARFRRLHRLEAERERRQLLPRLERRPHDLEGPHERSDAVGASCGDGVQTLPAVPRAPARRPTST